MLDTALANSATTALLPSLSPEVIRLTRAQVSASTSWRDTSIPRNASIVLEIFVDILLRSDRFLSRGQLLDLFDLTQIHARLVRRGDRSRNLPSPAVR
jgi:hypothetical protein